MLRRYIFRVTACAGVLALSAAAGFAQSTPGSPSQGEGQRETRRTGRAGRRHAEGGRRAERLGLGRLNLSDAQREQLRGIESRYAAAFRTRREELHAIRQSRRQAGGDTFTAEQEARARQLREELRADAERMRGEMRAVLTEEQRTQLRSAREELKQQRELRRERRDEFRERRRERRQRQQQPPGTTDQL